MAIPDSEIKNWTKVKLKRYLTSHDQKLPKNEQLRSFYLKKVLIINNKIRDEISDDNDKSLIVKSKRKRIVKRKTPLKSNVNVVRTKYKRSNKNRNRSKSPAFVKYRFNMFITFYLFGIIFFYWNIIG